MPEASEPCGHQNARRWAVKPGEKVASSGTCCWGARRQLRTARTPSPRGGRGGRAGKVGAAVPLGHWCPRLPTARPARADWPRTPDSRRGAEAESGIGGPAVPGSRPRAPPGAASPLWRRPCRPLCPGRPPGSPAAAAAVASAIASAFPPATGRAPPPRCRPLRCGKGPSCVRRGAAATAANGHRAPRSPLPRRPGLGRARSRRALTQGNNEVRVGLGVRAGRRVPGRPPRGCQACGRGRLTRTERPEVMARETPPRRAPGRGGRTRSGRPGCGEGRESAGQPSGPRRRTGSGLGAHALLAPGVRGRGQFDRRVRRPSSSPATLLPAVDSLALARGNVLVMRFG